MYDSFLYYKTMSWVKLGYSNFKFETPTALA